MKYTILLFEDEDDLRDEIKESILLEDMEVHAFNSWESFKKNHSLNHADLAVLDINLMGENGIFVFQQLKNKFPDIEGIIITGQPTTNNAIASLKLGIRDYLEKPFRAKSLIASIKDSESYQNYVSAFNLYDEISTQLDFEFIGNSQVIQTTKQLIHRVAQTNETHVLITGESGTGKELVAKSIHQLSKRKEAAFHSVNCSAIPDNLFESEFFGYEKGAFTGANHDHAGWFEHANGGTLFLDEIGEMNLILQAKLLRVLDEKKVNRLGSHKAISINTRIICATNQNLKKQVEQGKFRLDLYHRLNSFNITVPPLRERKEDIPLLVHHFSTTFTSKENQPKKKIHPEAINSLMNYDFPGNIRELKNIVEKSILMCDTKILFNKDLKNIHSEIETPSISTLNLATIEKETIQKAMNACSNNKTKTAEMLHITRQALNRKLKKFNIE